MGGRFIRVRLLLLYLVTSLVMLLKIDQYCMHGCMLLNIESKLIRYAIREGTSRVKIFKNFKEKKSFKPEFGAEGIFGGQLLGVTSGNSLSFYDWESLELVRRIEIAVKHV